MHGTLTVLFLGAWLAVAAASFSPRAGGALALLSGADAPGRETAFAAERGKPPEDGKKPKPPKSHRGG